MSGHRSLAFRLHARLRDSRAGSGNLLLAPHGIWSALTLLLPGASGTTREQLIGLLGVDGLEPVRHLAERLARREQLTSQQRMLVERNLTRTIDPESLRVRRFQGQKLWVQDGYRLEPGFIAALDGSRESIPGQVDFADAPDDACAAIDRWARDATAGRIPSFMGHPDALSPVTRAIVTGVTCLEARWAESFPQRATRDEPFLCLDGSRVSVPTMHCVAQLGAAVDDDVHVVEIPYHNPDLVLDLIVPRPGRFEAVDQVMSMAYVFLLLGELDHQTVVDLRLPRIAMQSDLRLGETLAALGAGEVFSTSADFTALSGEPGFHLDDVRHRTLFAVDEHGTGVEALTMPTIGAAGPTGAARSGGSGGPGDPLQLRIDRPFFFLVRDVPSNSILLFGLCANPGV